MQEEFKVAIIQANQVWEDKEANFKNYNFLIENITADLFLFPEMFQTGFTMNVNELAEEWGDSISLNYLKEIAIKKNTACYSSLIIKEGEDYKNRGVFIEPNGEVTIYDKRKSFGLAGEHEVFKAGNEQIIKEYKGWNFLLQICYDLRFPEIQLNHIIEDKPLYDVLLTVANWPERRNTHWKTLLTARAIENQVYVCAANRVGTDQSGLNYSGDSAIIDALGTNLAHASFEETVLLTTLHSTKLKETRHNLPFIKDRKI